MALDFRANVAFSNPTITFAITRDAMSVTGEKVQLDLTSATGFNLPSAVYANYEARNHDLEIKWTVTPPAGEPATWTKTDRTIDAFKDRLVFWGSSAFYIPSVAGTYTVECEASDRFGNTDTVSDTFTVLSVDALAIPSSRTFILYDGVNLTGAPAHDAGNRYTEWHTLINSLPDTAVNVRVAVLGGHTFTGAGIASLSDDNFLTGIYVEQYGTGQSVIECNDPGTNDCAFMLFNTAWAGTFVLNGDFLIQRETPWRMNAGNPLRTGTSWGTAFEFRSTTAPKISLSGVSIDGFLDLFASNGSQTLPEIGCEDCDFLHYINFLAFINGSQPGSFMLRGCRYDNPPDVFAGAIRHQNVSTVEFYGASAHTNRFGNMKIIFDGCQQAFAFGWSWTPQDWQQHQPNRLDQAGDAGSKVVVTRCLLEGTAFALVAGGGATNDMLFERNIILGGTQGMGGNTSECGHSGITWRNNIFISPDLSRDPGAEQNKLGFFVTTRDANPQKFMFNTFIDLRAGPYDVNNVGVDLGGLPTEIIQEESNLIYCPNYDTPIVPDGVTMVSRAESVTPNNTVGSVLGFVQVDLTENLNVGDTSAPINWPNDVDGSATSLATFSGGLGHHYIQEKLFSRTAAPFYRISVNDVGGGQFTVTVDANWVPGDPNTLIDIGVYDYVIRLDRRHDPIARPGSATPAGSGTILEPSANIPVAINNEMGAPRYDFFGVERTGTACQGAVQVA